MKPLFILLLLVGITYSCTNEADKIPTAEMQAASVASDLHLDKNHAKWRADEYTASSVESMQQLIEAFNNGNNFGSLEAYQELGKTMQGELNTLFRKCTMTGPAHEELHTFLTPIMKDIKVLQGEDLQAATTAQIRIEERLSIYQTYFE